MGLRIETTPNTWTSPLYIYFAYDPVSELRNGNTNEVVLVTSHPSPQVLNTSSTTVVLPTNNEQLRKVTCSGCQAKVTNANYKEPRKGETGT